MPEVIHCRVKGCGKAIHAENFQDGMAKLRHHRRVAHPRLHRQSIEKGVKTRRARGG